MCHATEHFTPQYLQDANMCNTPIPLEEVSNGVVNSHTKENITRHSQLISNPVLRDVWLKDMCIELGRISNGYKYTKGTQTIHCMTHEEIKCIPGYITVKYAHIVVDFRPQKKDPNRVRITVDGNLIDYPYELTTRTSDITTSRVMWNSVISTPGAKYACADVKTSISLRLLTDSNTCECEST